MPNPTRRDPPAAPQPPAHDADDVVLVDIIGGALAEFDTIRGGVFIEALAAPDGAPPHPVPGRAAQSATTWATMRIYWKTVQRIESLARAVAARPSRDPDPTKSQVTSPDEPWYLPWSATGPPRPRAPHRGWCRICGTCARCGRWPSRSMPIRRHCGRRWARRSPGSRRSSRTGPLWPALGWWRAGRTRRRREGMRDSGRAPVPDHAGAAGYTGAPPWWARPPPVREALCAQGNCT